MRADISGPNIWWITISGAAVLVAAFFAPALGPIWAAAWLVVLASRVRLHISGGGTPPISSRELAEWAAFYRMEPWGAEAQDWRAGLIASTIANANRDPRRRRVPYQPSDFMPRREPVPEQSPEQQERILRAWVEGLRRRHEGGHGRPPSGVKGR